jgi:uncharacterized protein
MNGVFSGFDGDDGDDGNIAKCGKHGVSIAEIEGLILQSDPLIGDDVEHSVQEQRFCAFGNAPSCRPIFRIFCNARDRWFKFYSTD